MKLLACTTLGIMACVLLYSCSKDKDNSSLKIGDPHLGGTVAYIFQSGDPGFEGGKQHGIVASQYDQNLGNPTTWATSSVVVGASATAIGSGKINTDSILLKFPSGTNAANICHDLVLNGYDDWHLPSKDELFKMYQKKDSIRNFNIGARYWSSTESATSASTQAVVVRFGDGVFINQTKTTVSNLVRAVRYF